LKQQYIAFGRVKTILPVDKGLIVAKVRKILLPLCKQHGKDLLIGPKTGGGENSYPHLTKYLYML